LLENAFADDGDIGAFAVRLDCLPVADDDDVNLSAEEVRDGHG
jgi:hypothetical protein